MIRESGEKPLPELDHEEPGGAHQVTLVLVHDCEAFRLEDQMLNCNLLSDREKNCIVRFLYHVATIDNQVVPEEIEVVAKTCNYFGISVQNTSHFWKRHWDVEDNNLLFMLMRKFRDIPGWLVNQCMTVMDADMIQHQNERLLIVHLVQSVVGSLEFHEAVVVNVDESDEMMIRMLRNTPRVCIEKGDWWQKRKKGDDSPLKKVGASLLWEREGKQFFVTAANYELTTPGGSRCAEQNCIGMAIAQDPKLRFEEINKVVIYGSGGLRNPCWPCGVCMENLQKINKEDQLKIYAFPKGYVYDGKSIPKTMLELSVSSLNHR